MIQGRSQEAKKYFSHAVAISSAWSVSKLSHTNSSDTRSCAHADMRAASGLAGILESEGSLAPAAVLYARALSDGKRAARLDSSSATGIEAVLSTLYFRLGKLDQAETLKSMALDYQEKAVGLRAGASDKTGDAASSGCELSERAQVALSNYAELLYSSGKTQESKLLVARLDAIQKAARHELNLSRQAQDQLVEFIIALTKNIIGTKYNTAFNSDRIESLVRRGELSDHALQQLRQLCGRHEWTSPSRGSAKTATALRIDQLSVSNRTSEGAVPVEVTGTAVIKQSDKDGLPLNERFRLKYLVEPQIGRSGHPLVTQIQDSSHGFRRFGD